MKAVAEREPVIVLRELQRLGHGLIGERPVPIGVVDIVLAVLQEDANRLWRRLANQRRIVVSALAPCGAAGDIREAADPRQHFAELVGPLPRNREGADPAAAAAGDRPARSVVPQLRRLFYLGKNLLEEETGVLIRQRVVF